MIWNSATIVQLRRLWDEGLSAAEIGRQMGVSKSAAIGKAHRLDLPARPSPIIRAGAPQQPLSARRQSVRPPAPRSPARLPVAPFGRIVNCCWPLGDPRIKKSFRFCGDTSVPGSPYCWDHHKIAYLKKHQQEEDNVAQAS